MNTNLVIGAFVADVAGDGHVFVIG